MAAKDKIVHISKKTGRGKKKKLSVWKKLLIVLLVLFVFMSIFLIAYFMNHITTVEVEGNSFYTEDEIKEMVMSSELEHNAWYLYWEYQYSSDPPKFPFIDKIEVELLGRGHVRLCVYEKSIVGYVEYLGGYMYFDKDGTVVESSSKEMEHVPKIIGLQFDSIVLYEKLPVERDEVFHAILNLTKELKKNDIMPEKIQYNSNLEATLYFGEARVLLGSDSGLNEKITRLKALVPKLEGKSGILHMEEVDEDNKNIVFKSDGS